MSYERKLKYLNNQRVIYRRLPENDTPDIENNMYMYYENGTHECYELFRSKAKITTYKSLKWHLLVLWYLNPDFDKEKMIDIGAIITHKPYGFTSFEMDEKTLLRMIDEIEKLDLDRPPKNKLRKVMFKQNCGLTKEEKLKIVGTLIGRSKKVHADDIYECMLDLNDMGKKITIGRIAGLLDCSSRTIHRNMCEELRREKQVLNELNTKE
jgi:hypothetical protein